MATYPEKNERRSQVAISNTDLWFMLLSDSDKSQLVNMEGSSSSSPPKVMNETTKQGPPPIHKLGIVFIRGQHWDGPVTFSNL